MVIMTFSHAFVDASHDSRPTQQSTKMLTVHAADTKDRQMQYRYNTLQ